jgi:hypothetical protein
MANIVFANTAAATAAGYKLTQTDRGAPSGPGQQNKQYQAVFSKPLIGGSHQSGYNMRAMGEHAVQTSAVIQALAALNNQRGHRYGFGTTVQVNDDGHDVVEVLDAT